MLRRPLDRQLPTVNVLNETIFSTRVQSNTSKRRKVHKSTTKLMKTNNHRSENVTNRTATSRTFIEQRTPEMKIKAVRFAVRSA